MDNALLVLLARGYQQIDKDVNHHSVATIQSSQLMDLVSNALIILLLQEQEVSVEEHVSNQIVYQTK